MPRKYIEDGTWWHEFGDGRRVQCQELTCEACGKTFASYRGGRYCSRPCAGLRERMSEEEREMAIALYAEGKSLVHVAAEMGRNEMTIGRLLRKRGIPIRQGPPTKPVTEAEHAAIIEGWDASVAIEEIAARVHVHANKVRRVLRDAGHDTTQKRIRTPRQIDGNGYVWIVDHDSPRTADGRVRRISEHRAVLAKKFGRPLQPHETVHHINGDHADNRAENLELRIGRHGKGATAAHCATCTCFPET